MSMSQETIDYSIPKHIARKLKRDAARLAIRMEADSPTSPYSEIEIPQDKAKTIFNLLEGIYDSGYSEATMVFDCNIRAATDIAIDRFWIIYEKDIDWAASFNYGEYEAEGAMGDLLDEYELLVTEKKSWNESQDIITIESTQLYNMLALVKEFEGLDGVLDIVTHNSDMKPDSDIELTYNDKIWTVSFIKKWSSLKDTKTHTWSFEVHGSTLKTEFKGETGDIIPEWMRCELNSGYEF